MMKTGGEPDKDVHISLEDQQKINKFARDLVNQSSIFMAQAVFVLRGEISPKLVYLT